MKIASEITMIFCITRIRNFWYD